MTLLASSVRIVVGGAQPSPSMRCVILYSWAKYVCPVSAVSEIEPPKATATRGRPIFSWEQGESASGARSAAAAGLVFQAQKALLMGVQILLCAHCHMPPNTRIKSCRIGGPIPVSTPLPVFPRTHATGYPEGAVEGRQRVEAATVSNVSDGHLRIGEQRNRGLHPAVEQMLVRRATDEPYELLLKTANAHPAQVGQRRHGQRFLKARGDPLQGRCDPRQRLGAQVRLDRPGRFAKRSVQFVDHQEQQGAQIGMSEGIVPPGLEQQLLHQLGEAGMLLRPEYVGKTGSAESRRLPAQVRRGARHQKPDRFEKEPGPSTAGAGTAPAAMKFPVGQNGDVALVEGQDLGADIECTRT